MGDRLRLVYTQVLCKPSWLVAAVLLRVKSEKGFRNVSSQRRWLKTCWQIDAPLSGQVTRGECKLCEYQTLKVGKHLHFKVHLAFLGFQMNLVILTVRWRLPSFQRNADIQILELAKLAFSILRTSCQCWHRMNWKNSKDIKVWYVDWIVLLCRSLLGLGDRIKYHNFYWSNTSISVLQQYCRENYFHKT